MTDNATLTMQREELINELRAVDDINVIQKVQRSLKRALVAVKKAAAQKKAEEEEEYISREELEEKYLNAFIELFRAKKEGRNLKSARELIDEL